MIHVEGIVIVRGSFCEQVGSSDLVRRHRVRDQRPGRAWPWWTWPALFIAIVECGWCGYEASWQSDGPAFPASDAP